MPKSLYAIPPLLFNKAYRFYFLLLLLVVQICFSQQHNTLNFDGVLDQLLTTEPTAHDKIATYLGAFEDDSLKLQLFAAQARENNYDAGHAYALNRLGTLYRKHSKYEKALRLHQSALALSKETNSELRVASHNLLGIAHRQKGALRTALDHHQKVLVITDSLANPPTFIKKQKAEALGHIGQLYNTLGQSGLAIAAFKQALFLEDKLKNTLGMARANYQLASCFERKEQFQQALEHYKKALALDMEVGDLKSVLYDKNAMASVYLKLGKATEAQDLLGQVKQATITDEDPYLKTQLVFNTGRTLQALGQLNASEKYLNEGLQLAKKNDFIPLIIAVNRSLSELEQKRGQYDKALAYRQVAERYYRDSTQRQYESNLHDMLLKYEAQNTYIEISGLKQKNELVILRIRKNQTMILVSCLIIGLVGSVLFIMYHQYRSNQNKRVIGLEQHMLRSQMNPHFLFNSLNSIKLYIINNDKKNAVHYLNKFSKLVRRILEGSSLKEIALSEELETAELYLNIEKIRFSDEINYEINVSGDINPDMVKIPSLVLQPFLENAIWHGLSSKHGEKNIWLNISRKDDMHIHINIVDNGVGRKASEKIKEKRVLKRKSVGIDITKERLANFAKDFQNDFKIKIIDLFDDDGLPKGTKVLVEIPTV